MGKRREKEEREIRKIAKRKTIVKVALGWFIDYVIITIVLRSLMIQLWQEFEPKFHISLYIVAIVFLTIMMLAFGLFLFYPEEIKKERHKRSSTFVKKSLAKHNRVGVIPINAPLRYWTFLTNELPSLGKFYATLKDDSYVTIEFKINDDKTYYFVENVEKEQFTYYYDLKKHEE